MKKYQKVFALALAMLMLISVFAVGCAKKEEPKPAAETKQEDVKKEEPKAAEPKKEEVKYPTKPIQVIVPAGAGGDTDFNARILGKALEKEIGQPIVIVNVNGAGGSLGSKKVKDSDPDGYNVLFFHPGMLLNKMLGLTEFTFSDLEVAAIAVLDDTNVFAVNAEAPYNNLQEFVEAAKKEPKKYKFATEVGSFTHLQSLAFQKAADVELNIVDVGGAAQKTAALLGKQIDVIGTQYGLIKDHITSGKFKVLGVMSEEKNPLMPEVPTFKEQGYDVAFTKYFFYAFPKGTPKEIVEKFSKAVENVVKNDTEYQQAAKNFLVSPTYMAPEEAIKYLKDKEAFYDTFKETIMSQKK
ncbi:tripartite tricarboxylate transporter substrate binding protein [Petroclostridium sp. X23]|uniref:tripartite tricarboxylate transporter substrate binding protein n=1 Tax=Petroclostridium sp. X23 TaxID=3045146 RepID=UPI0024AE1D4C|nr:tripartite tricarboxylate transporter substrate binding protein [Petroclostridium sp. X23]WHH57622.1 tripartite tricarboxylate transporter substrate binding protein [Petroclostridium sp. X23]